MLAKDSSKAHDQAEASFKKKEQQLREGAKAMAEYRAVGMALDAKTARLKSLRLAKEAADRETKMSKKPIASRSKPVASKSKPVASRSKPVTAKKPVMSRKKSSFSPAD